MAEFKVDTKSLEQLHIGLSSIQQSLGEISLKLGAVELGSVLQLNATLLLIQKINSCRNSAVSSAAKFGKLSQVVEEIAQQYTTTENRLSGNELERRYSGTAGENGDYRVDSIVFDDDGTYGGNQGSPELAMGEEREALYDIIRRYYPNMTDAECADFLSKLNSEGCGYVAIINSIFVAYEGRGAEFESTFGFPMYDENGDLNYNRLLVDMYSATDNHNKGFFGNDYIKTGEDIDSTTGRGTSPSDRAYRASLYLNEHGVNVDVQQGVNVTPENFSSYDNGSVIVSFHDGNLYNADGSVAQYIDGGHAMVITGVTADGRYIVSSWGKEYYLDPSDGTYVDFSYWQY